VKLLREIGFNRMSLGVQDFDERVQKAVNRIQTEAETMEVLQSARDEGFRSISIDLIYGLPYQTVEGFMATLERIIEVNPDRCRCSTMPTCRAASSRSGASPTTTCRRRRSSSTSCRPPPSA
jgi:coproporphyrinogen III oxidase-like Fe-S oxidoreductase